MYQHQFWSIYTLDIYASVVFGGMIRHREALSAVGYPSEVVAQDDAQLLDFTQGVSWIRGWNFTTDLYRILEHIVNNSQQTSTTFSGLFPTFFSPDDILLHMQRLYGELPTIFKTSHPMTGSIGRDRFTFQTANIMVTMQVNRGCCIDEIGSETQRRVGHADTQDGFAPARIHRRPKVQGGWRIDRRDLSHSDSLPPSHQRSACEYPRSLILLGRDSVLKHHVPSYTISPASAI